MTEEERRNASSTSAFLAGKTIFVSGSSRGIGLAIARRAASDSANVALLAKSAEPQSELEGTIYAAAEEIEDAGGRALPIAGDVRDADAVETAVERAAE
jgi:citronellol/citronellal dehydrogenase